MGRAVEQVDPEAVHLGGSGDRCIGFGQRHGSAPEAFAIPALALVQTAILRLGMAALMYNAVTATGEPKTATSSLLPSGQGLDLFVTLTDYFGYRRPVQIHDPLVIHALEHRHVLHFKYRRRLSGEVESDFGLDNAPALPCSISSLARSRVHAIGLFLSRQGRFMFLVL
jgi:hypothetical protein